MGKFQVAVIFVPHTVPVMYEVFKMNSLKEL